MVEAAVAEGALGYLVKPIEPSQLIPAVEAVLARAREADALLHHKGQLEQALARERIVSLAVGILMERRRLDRTQAFAVLRNSARTRRLKLERWAQELVDALELIDRD
jgi:response regulator NasT